jgi:anti-sigma factor (TIGR02949 family)
MACTGNLPEGVPAIDCGDVMAKLWDYLDGDLDAETVAAIRAHLDACGHCLPHAEYGDAFLRAVKALRRPPETAADAPVRAPIAGPSDPGVAALRARVLDRLRAEGFEDEPAA